MRLLWKKIDRGQGHTVGRALLAELYQGEKNAPLPQVQIAQGGKPYLPDGPYFSISHTRHYAFCVMSEKPVGIDAEELDRNINLALAEKILSASEYARYQQQADKRLALLRFWVLKEAYCKVTGTGLRGYPNHTDFSPDDPRIQILGNCLVAIIGE